VYNLALSAIHAKGAVASLLERSREREVCERWYPLVRDTVQEAAYWPSCTATERLALAEERNFSLAWSAGNPAPQYSFVYYLPADYLRARYLASFLPFTVEFDSTRSRRMLHTSEPDAALVYTRQSDNVLDWTPGQKMATVYGLAAHIAGPITGSRALTADCISKANSILMDAQASAQNAQDQQAEILPAVFQARGYAGGVSSPAFYYPTGGYFSAAVVNV
jgi:hypothetical protein